MEHAFKIYPELTTEDKSVLESGKEEGHIYEFLTHNGIRMQYNIDTALAQIAEMEREQKPDGCEYCRDGKDLWDVAGCNKARIDPENNQLDVMDGYGNVYYCDIYFCPMCGKRLKAEE